MIDREALLARVEEIKKELWTIRESDKAKLPGNVEGSIQSTLGVLVAIYGNPSPQVQRFVERTRGGGPTIGDRDGWEFKSNAAALVDNVLDSAVGDLKAGVTGSIGVQAKGVVLGDFVALAREALNQRDVPSDRVAAVLTAAALEETLKQMGEAKGVDVYNRDMRGVIQKLKDANVLKGARIGSATGFVPFRDFAFHGQFEKIDRPTTEGALAFVEGLLAEAFS